MIIRCWEYKNPDGQWADLSEKLTAEQQKQLEQDRASLDTTELGEFGRYENDRCHRAWWR